MSLPRKAAMFVIAALAVWLIWPAVQPGSKEVAGPAVAAVGPQDAATTVCSLKLEFTAYWVGPEFQGLPLSYARTRCQREDPSNPALAANHYIGFIYGECIPEEDVCQPPLEIQTAPRSERHRSLYTFNGVSYPWTATTINNRNVALEATSASFDAGTVLELYPADGATTISIFSTSPDLAMKAAESVAPAPAGGVPPGGP